MRSLSEVGVSTVSVVADGEGNVVGGDLVADLSRGLDDRLDNRVVSHGTNGGKGVDSRGVSHRGSGVGEGTKNHSRVSLSVPLDNGMGESVAKTMVAKTSVAQTSVTHSGNSGGMDQRGVVDHREDRGVVDERGGCAEDGGTSSDDCGISIPLHDGVGKSVAKAVVAKTSVTQTSITQSGNSRGMVDHREDRGVVDEGGGCGKHLGVSSKHSSISLPLAIDAMESIASISVVANSDRDSVGSHLMADLCGGHLNGLDNRVAGNGTNRGKAEGCRGSNDWGSGIWEGSVPCKEKLRVGLRGGGRRGNNC